MSRGRGPLLGGLGAVAVVGVAGFAAVGWIGGGTGESAGEAGASASAEASPERSRRSPSASAGAGEGGSGDGPSSSPGSSPGKSSPSKSASASASASSSESAVTIPRTGPGTFTTAPGGSGKVGKGTTPLRYRVEVEKGLALSPAEVAEEVEAVLADPRGWTTDGKSAFQRVSGGATDFVVKLATPGTVDEFCGRVGLNTRGEYNCQAGDDVMVNLERWELATPVYADDVEDYRALIINHEVGHFLGQGHVTCPGAGKPAPAMMQQIKGMKGCVPNVWPYDDRGRRITGPSVP